MGPKLKSFCTTKETLKMGEVGKNIFRKGENVCKQCDQQGINLQNIHAAQCQKKTKKLKSKIIRKSK